MIDMAYNALCCWSTSQQSPIDDTPSSPDSPCSAQSVPQCTCSVIGSSNSIQKSTVVVPHINSNVNSLSSLPSHSYTNQIKNSSSISQSSSSQPHSICKYHNHYQLTSEFSSNLKHARSSKSEKKRLQSTVSIPPPARSWPRSNHVKDVMSKKNSPPSSLDVVSPYHSTTFMLTSPSSYSYNGNQHYTSTGKSPSKRFSLQKYYYGRNTMSVTSKPSRTPSPPIAPVTSISPSLSSLPASPSSHSIPESLRSPSLLSSLSLSNLVSATIPERTASNSVYQGTNTTPSIHSPLPRKASNAGSLSILIHGNPQSNNCDSNNNSVCHRNSDPFVVKLDNSISSSLSPSSSPSLSPSDTQDMPSRTRCLSPPTLTTIMATPTTPSLPSLPSLPFSLSPPSSHESSYPSPCSPSFSSSLSSKYCIDNNGSISSPDKSDSTPYPASSISPSKLAHLIDMSASAGSRRPLILDLRPNPEFCPISIAQSININLPTLLMRRYRRGGGSVSSFALESFITMPSDKDIYNQILDSWRSAFSNVDVVVLDQNMKAGEEEYGRSATAAWTLLNVLERGGGNNCFGGASINLWYLNGGFDSFQEWDSNGKYLERPESFDSQKVPSVDQDVEMVMAAPLEVAAPTISKKPSLSINTSVVFEPKQRTPVRRESLFSLNTKSLQRPTGLSRSQTVNLKPLIIPSPNNTANTLQPPQNQQLKGSWLTVPASTAAAVSPTMSVVSNHSMEISHSASTDHSSSWSADSSSINGSGHFPPAGLGMTLSTKRSTSSLLTINSANAMSTTSIREEEEEEECSQSGSGSRWSEESTKDGSHLGNDSFVSQYSDSNEEVDEDASEQEISCILPGFLYLGPEILHQHQVDELDRLGVKRIVNMAKECEDSLVCNRQGMEYHKIGVYDHIEADVQAGLLKAVEIIASSTDSPVYVHCKAGKSRSVTATIAYLITQLHWPLNKAYQHVLQQRPCMCPNIGFVTELMRMETQTLGADKASGIYCA